MSIISRLHRWASPACAVPRLRALYFVSLALCGTLLIMLHIALACAQRLAHALTVETRAAVAVPHVIVLRVPPSLQAATMTKFNMYHAVHAVSKEK